MEQEHIALYRRFRPQTFDEITSQDAPVTALKQAVRSGKIGHAYLFSGQRGTGKTTIAKVFSRAINCLNPKDGNPCNECEVCKGILSGSLLDVIEIDAASNNGVENVRRICDEAVFAPTKARYKVYIIDEVHMLSTGAYNALLKTLEEPPKHVVFLFATTEPHKILPTILSRCQRYNFKRIPDDLIVKRLRYICDKEDIKADDDALKQIAALSDGALRDAISLLDQAAGAADGKEITSKSIQDIAGTVDTAFLLEMGDILIDGNYEALLRLCARISESGRDYLRFTLDLAEYFRDLLVIRVVPDPTELLTYSASDMKQLYRTANKANADTLIGFISYLSKLASELKMSPSVAANFETGLIRICGRKTSLPVTPLVIPDFAKKQAEAASRISSPDTTEPVKEAPKAEEKPKVSEAEDKKPENKPENKPEVPVSAPVKTEDSPKEEKKEEKKEENKEQTGFRSEKLNLFLKEPAKTDKKDTEAEAEKEKETPKEESKKEDDKILSVSERLAQLKASLGSSRKEEEDRPKEAPKEETKSNPVSAFLMSAQAPKEPLTIITAPSVPDEDAPLENQIDLFGSLELNSNKKEEAKKEEPKKEDLKKEPSASAPEEPKKKGILGLSESFVDDIDMSFVKEKDSAPEPKEEEKEEKKEDKKAAPARKPVPKNGRTSLSAVYDKSGLIVGNPHTKEVRQPDFGETNPDNIGKWENTLYALGETNPNLHNTLRKAEFMKIDDNGYIVFDDSYRNIVENLKGMNDFRRLAQQIKASFDGVSRLFVCTKTQYNNALIQNEKKKKQAEAEALRAKAEQMGITTELHFGDD